VVCIPGLDDQLRQMRFARGEELVIEETGPDSVLVSWLPDSALRRASDFHMTYRHKEVEEEKRVFYVACTRARDGLFLTGTLHSKATEKSRLGWLAESIGLRPDEYRFEPDPDIRGLRCVSSADIPELPSPPKSGECRPKASPKRPPLRTAPGARPRIQTVTRHTGRDLIAAGPDAIGIGDVIHRLLELVSKAEVDADGPDFSTRIEAALRRVGLSPRLAPGIRKHIARLQSNPAIWQLVAPCPDAEAEVPVMYSDGETLWSGRIDRLILAGTEARIYDYKTFSIDPGEAEAVAREYHDAQLRRYADAIRLIHPDRRVSTFVIFTALPLVVRTS